MNFNKLLISIFSILLSCFLFGCGGSDVSGEGGGSKYSISMNSKNIYSMEFVNVKIESKFPLESMYRASIESQNFDISRHSGNNYYFIAPNLPDGNYVLKVNIGGEVIEREVAINKYKNIQNPGKFLNDLMTAEISAIDGILASSQVFDTGKPRDDILSLRNSVSGYISKINELSQEDKIYLANFVNVNITKIDDPNNVFSQISAAKYWSYGNENKKINNFNEIDCTNGAKEFAVMVTEFVAINAGISVMVDLLPTLASSGVAPIAVGVTIGIYVGKIAQLIKKQKEVYAGCLEIVGELIIKGLEVGAQEFNSGRRGILAASKDSWIFKNGESRSFDLFYPKKVKNQDALNSANIFHDSVFSVIEALPSGLVPQSWVNLIAPDNEEKLYKSDSSRYIISSVSDKNINEKISSSSGSVVIGFSFINQSQYDSIFKFELTDEDNSISTTFDAVLEKNFLPSSLSVSYDWVDGVGGVIKANLVGLTAPVKYSVNGGIFSDDSVLYGVNEGYYSVVAIDANGVQTNSVGMFVTKIPYYVNSIVGKRWQSQVGQKSCKSDYELAEKVAFDSVRIFYGCGVSGTTGQILKFYPITSDKVISINTKIDGYGVSGISTYSGFVIDYKLIDFGGSSFNIYSEYIASMYGSSSKGYTTWSVY